MSCDWLITAAVTAYVHCKSEVERSAFGTGLPSSTFKVLLLIIFSQIILGRALLYCLDPTGSTRSEKLTFYGHPAPETTHICLPPRATNGNISFKTVSNTCFFSFSQKRTFFSLTPFSCSEA